MDIVSKSFYSTLREVARWSERAAERDLTVNSSKMTENWLINSIIGWLTDWLIDLKSYKEKQCNLLGDSNFLKQKNIVLKQELTEIKLGITPHQHRRWTKIYVITEDLGLDKRRAMS